MRKTKLTIFLAIISLALFGVAEVASAAEYYVATNGSDTNTGAIDSPWQNISYATCAGSYLCPIQASNSNKLKAGDTLYIRGGTYNQYEIRFTNSGTAGNPITVRSYPGETAIVDGGFTVSSGRKPVFNIDNVNYITIDGLTIMRGSMANVYLAYNYGPTTNIVIQNCDIKDVVTDDNAGNIFIGTSGADNVFIQNNKIHDRILGGAYNNVGEGIKIFRARNLYISNNEIYGNLSNGIYYKHSNNDSYTNIVENNLIRDFGQQGILWARRASIIRNNIIRDSATGVGIRVFEEAADCGSLVSDSNQILHNTIMDVSKGIILYRSNSCPGAVDTTIKDNLIYNFTNNEMRGFAIYPYYSGTDISNTTFDHNLVYSASYPNPIRVISAYYNTITAPLTGFNNVQSVPTFVDYSGNDFTLATGSAGENASSDGVDMGAKICDVGINASCATVFDTTAPSAPQGLVVQ